MTKASKTVETAVVANVETAQQDDANEIVTVTLSNAHKTNTAIILKKGATDSVDGKERWFAKKDIKSFKKNMAEEHDASMEASADKPTGSISGPAGEAAPRNRETTAAH